MVQLVEGAVRPEKAARQASREFSTKIQRAILCVFLVAFAHVANCAEVLFYDGVGATSGDIADLEAMIARAGYSYKAVDAADLAIMTPAELAAYKLIVWPGGNAITQENALHAANPEIFTNIHNAVVKSGVSYIGFCAGSFIAETSNEYHTFDLARTYFNFYKQNAIEMVTLEFPQSSNLEVVYWNGPVVNFGYTVARFPNRAEAIGEDFVGNGFVILSGVHPEAALNWGVSGNTAAEDTADNSYAVTLIKAAYNRTLLPHY